MDTGETAKATERGKLPPTERLCLVTICLDEGSATQLRRLVDSIPMVQLRAELQSYPSEEEDLALNWLKDLQPDVLLIDFDQDREKATRAAEAIRNLLSHTAVFASSAVAHPDVIIRAMRCGCSEYLAKPIDRDQLLEALARVGGRRNEKREQKVGQLLAFLGAKGGAGVTTLVAYLAVLLAKTCSRKTLLIDLHPHLGDASLYLGLNKHPYHFHELADNTHRLDDELLQGFLAQHPCGLHVLPAPDGFETTRHLSEEGVSQTLEFLRQRYEFLLVDCPSGLSDQNLAVIHRSDQVYLIAIPEISALRNVVRYLDQLQRLDYPPERVRMVLNRYSKKGSITDMQVEKAIHRSIFWKVPNQYNEVMKSIHNGDPLSQPDSEFMRSLTAWARALGEKPAQNSKKKEGKGILGLWSR